MSKIKTQKDLITNLKSTDEYKRSKAIAGCITFLSDKIKELESDKNNLLTKLDDLSKKNLSQKDLNIKLKSELEVQKSQNGLYKKKLTVLEELNKQLKHKIKKYEILLYKMDLENQGYKDEIQKYQNQLSTITGQSINFIPIYKIDLNSELENIDNDDINYECNSDKINSEENFEI